MSTTAPAGDTFREISGKPIRWHDRHGLVHACEGARLHRGMPPLVWTLCKRDVPANEAFHPGDADDAVTCAACLAALHAEHGGGRNAT